MIVFQHLGEISEKKILDFGSGDGITASFLARENDVTAIEPSVEMLEDCCRENEFQQLIGGIELLKNIADNTFDMVVCHNVMEYVEDKQLYFKELTRVLKTGGFMSVIKHNRAGRVMQNVVLLNNFDHAYELLAGGNSNAAKFGVIRYYDDSDIEVWSPELKIESCKGIRTFWDLQQNQECHIDTEWQKQIVQMERAVENIKEYVNIAFFHHLLIRKK